MSDMCLSSDRSALNYVMMELYRIHTIPLNPSNKSTMSDMCLSSGRSALNYVMMEPYQIHTIPLNPSYKSTMSDRCLSSDRSALNYVTMELYRIIHVIDVLKKWNTFFASSNIYFPVCIARVKYYKVKLIVIRKYKKKNNAHYTKIWR